MAFHQHIDEDLVSSDYKSSRVEMLLPHWVLGSNKSKRRLFPQGQEDARKSLWHEESQARRNHTRSQHLIQDGRWSWWIRSWITMMRTSLIVSPALSGANVVDWDSHILMLRKCLKLSVYLAVGKIRH